MGKMTINEGWQLKQLVDQGKTPEGGIWFAGEKYTIPQVDKNFEMGENTFFWAFGARPKKGVHIVSTGSQIVVGFHSDEKGQSSGNCKSRAGFCRVPEGHWLLDQLTVLGLLCH